MERGDRDAAVAEFEEFHKTMGVTADRRALIRALVKVNEIKMLSTDMPGTNIGISSVGLPQEQAQFDAPCREVG